jgi:hypothetical protein
MEKNMSEMVQISIHSECDPPFNYDGLEVILIFKDLQQNQKWKDYLHGIAIQEVSLQDLYQPEELEKVIKESCGIHKLSINVSNSNKSLFIITKTSISYDHFIYHTEREFEPYECTTTYARTIWNKAIKDGWRKYEH